MANHISEWLKDEVIKDAIPLRDVPGHLPRLRCGKRVHISTIYRWVKSGVRGARLMTFWVGGTQCTTLHLLTDFLGRLSGSPERSFANQKVDHRCSSRDVERELDRLGI